MVWTIHSYQRQLFLGDKPLDLWANKYFALNDDGVLIEEFGYRGDVGGYLAYFDYRYGDLAFQFTASRPSKELVKWDPRKDPIALGPEAVVLVDDGRVERVPLSDEVDKIKEAISEFLIQAYPTFKSAVPPYPPRELLFFASPGRVVARLHKDASTERVRAPAN